MAPMLIDFLHDGHTLAAIVERDVQTGEPVRSLLIVPPDPPRDPGDYSIILYHAVRGTEEEEVGCRGTAAEAIRFALARYEERFPVLRQNGWWSFAPQPGDAQGGDGAAREDHLVVAPDGSGDVHSLEDAVRVAAPGATPLLPAGTHQLSCSWLRTLWVKSLAVLGVLALLVIALGITTWLVADNTTLGLLIFGETIVGIVLCTIMAIKTHA